MALAILASPAEAAGALAAPETPGCAAHFKHWVLLATALSSSVVFFEATVINVALPAIQQGLGVPVSTVQWIASGYTLVLAALTLVGGALGDRFGRRRMLGVGLIVFAAATLVAGAAPSAGWLIAGRGLQGLGAALVAPNSLAHLSASFPRAERGRAVGVWSAAASLTGGAAPLLGGWLVDVGSWRAVFLAGVPLTLLALVVVAARLPENRAAHAGAALDVPGAVLAALAFSALIAGLIAAAGHDGGGTSLGLILAGVALLAGFLWFEARAAAPMLPPGLFRSRDFAGANLLTMLLYFAISGTFFLLPFALVQAYGHSATVTGSAFLPFALVVAALSRWGGGLVDRWGAKWPLVIGPALAALGLALLSRLPDAGDIWSALLPAMAVLGLAMAVTIPPLNTVVLGAVPPDQAGVASGVNNTIARLAAMLAVAVVGVMALNVFGGAVRDRLVRLELPAGLRDAVLAERRDLGDARVPATAGAAAPAIGAALRAALVDAFRAVALLCAGLAVAAAGCAALMIDPRAAGATRGAEAVFVCEHLGQVAAVAPPAEAVCDECVRLNQRWVHLRLCLACGHVGCCDASANQHATRHFRATGHPIVQALAAGESWRWCYLDEHVV